jgi:hypothetical protein
MTRINVTGALLKLPPPIDELRASLKHALRQVARGGRDAKRVKRSKRRVAQLLRQMNAEQALIDYFAGRFDRDANRPKGSVKDARAQFLKQLIIPRLERYKDEPRYRTKVAQAAFEFLPTEQGRATIREWFGSDQTFTVDEIRKAAGCR